MCNTESEWKELADKLGCKLEETIASIGELVETRRRGFITNDELVHELKGEVKLAEKLVREITIARQGWALERRDG